MACCSIAMDMFVFCQGDWWYDRHGNCKELVDAFEVIASD